MTWLEIRPGDVWLFRDGKPFNAGENNSAHSIFPPTPMTVQGALRQKISESNGLSYPEYHAGQSPLAQKVGGYIGTLDAQKETLDTGAFKMHGPFVGLNMKDRVMPFFPCPADLLMNEDTKAFFIAAPQDSPVISDLGKGYRFIEVRESYENLSAYWMTGATFASYLEGTVPHPDIYLDKDALDDGVSIKSAKQAIKKNKTILHSSLLYSPENRFGVSTDSATSFREEGKLYQAQFIRPTEDVSLLADVSGEHDDSHLEGLMTIGGEQRHANNSIARVQQFPGLPAKLSDRFKIIFLTPAYFSDGWRPLNDDWSELFGGDVRLVSAALYRPQRIGGWNSAIGKKGAQRAMHNYVAPGSVYYFEAHSSWRIQQAITENPKNIKNAAQIGFGQVAYSTW